MNERSDSGKSFRGVPIRLVRGEARPADESSADVEDVRSMKEVLSDLPKLFASAPHRMMFFAGATAVIVSMLWWACWLAASWSGHAFPVAPVPAGWAHAVLAQYGMLPPFIFGFLLTVFPRWMGQPGLQRRRYVPVFIGMFAGYLLAHLGLLDLKPVLLLGLGMMLMGWLAALLALGGVLLRAGGKDAHARSCFAALVLGFAGLLSFAAFVLGAPASLATFSIKAGSFALLIPVYFTVCHRMVPFFSANVVGQGYRVFKPRWSLPLLWVLLLAHLALDMANQLALLWLVDVPLAALILAHWVGWQPWKCLKPGLLAALYIAFFWLFVAFALYALQSALFFFDQGFHFARAPVHALTVGFFGSLLVAMVTRVTQGHSGRPLQMGWIPWLTFVMLQGVALARMYAEITPESARWLVIAAFGWLLAFLPWVLRSLWIFLTPRIDGRPG